MVWIGGSSSISVSILKFPNKKKQFNREKALIQITIPDFSLLLWGSQGWNLN